MTSKSSAMWSMLLAAVLALLAGPAWALGLGRIEVRSQPGQPLLAEIPIISNDPSELRNLQARLASPDTFRRVGLEPPGSEVAGLQFAVALDGRGRPVIRVTSAAPLQQPLLTFLLEVDWGEGRLVREYSALLDAPRTVAAPVQPVHAPTVAPSNTIARPVAPRTAPPPQPVADAAPGAASTAPPAPKPTAIAAMPPAPAAAPAPASAPAPAPAPAPTTDEYRVRAGETLNQIAAGMDRDGHSMAQTMLALLRANPEAFIGDNINLVKAGAVLRVPRGDELSRYSAREAAQIVHAQIVQWRQARAPQRQPDAVARSGARPDADAPSGAAPAKATDGARLEIVPPSPGRAAQAGTRSGIDAGGEGDMERQELQQTKETLAARDAEVQELKARVAELEKLQQQQQQLIEMKDSALAGAQQNLAKTNATATTQQPAEPEASASGGWWLLGGLGLLVLAMLAWLLLRGRDRAPPPGRPRFGTSDLAASLFAPEPSAGPGPGPGHDTPAHAHADTPAPRGHEPEAVAAVTAAPVMTGGPEPSQESQESSDRPTAVTQSVSGPREDEPVDVPHWTAAPALVGTAPTWHAGGEGAPAVARPAEATSAERTSADTPARQIELARAYLDLGDDDAARTLLLEALDGRDPGARETAARLLRDL